MKKIGFILIVTTLFLFIIFSQLKLSNHPVNDNDEGIYSTSFLLIDKGHPAYKETFFSQPPGFLLTVYPGFLLFGRTLPVARLTVAFWSIIGLVAIVWIGAELDNNLFSLLAISLLYLIPAYYRQTLILQSDILVSSFSLLSFAGLLSFRRLKRLRWFIVTALCLNIAFWTKFDVSFLPAAAAGLIFLFRDKTKPTLSLTTLTAIFLIVSILFFFVAVFPFGIREVFKDTVIFRFQAVGGRQSLFLLFSYLQKEVVLSLILVVTLILALVGKKKFDFPIKINLIWLIFTLLLFLFYRPLFSHHLVMLSVPAVLLFSQLFFTVGRNGNQNLRKFLVTVLLVLAVANRIYIMITTSSRLINNQQQLTVNLIKKYTQPADMVISDEEILNTVSQRLPPPQLSDVSYVRFSSNNLTKADFKRLIDFYKPKLIIFWSGRLQSVNDFNRILSDYKTLFSFDNTKNIYIRIEKQNLF